MKVFALLVLIAFIWECEACEKQVDELIRAHACQLGMKSGAIPDSAITASSTWSNDDNHSPKNARLDKHHQSSGNPGWSAAANTPGQWIQVDLSRLRQVSGVIIQGRGTGCCNNQRVTSYTVKYQDGSGWKSVGANGIEQVFEGNMSDNQEWNINYFKTAIQAKLVRIYPKTWLNHISLRFELLGC